MNISNVLLDCLLLHTDENLYPFGFSAGDSLLFRTDDGSSSGIFLILGFRFFGTLESILYVSLLTMDTCQIKYNSILSEVNLFFSQHIYVFQCDNFSASR